MHNWKPKYTRSKKQSFIITVCLKSFFLIKSSCLANSNIFFLKLSIIIIYFYYTYLWILCVSCSIMCNWPPLDCCLPGSSVHEILQARILECAAFAFSRGSSQYRGRTWVLHCRQILYCLSHQGNPFMGYSLIYSVIKMLG